MRRPLRFLSVGLGPLGLRVAADVQRRGLGAVVAAVDPAHAGRVLAELVPGAHPDVRIAADLATMTTEVDLAIVATHSDLAKVAPTLRALIERRISVVSTCEELSWPWDRHTALAGELAELALVRGAFLLGTGVNPGFVMDALPVAITTACNVVRHVEVHRIQDAATRRIPFQKKIGAGLTPTEFAERAADGSVRHVGLRESVGMIASSLGLPVDRVDETIAPVVAEAPLSCALGPIAAGAVRGVHQEARAFAGDREVVALVFQAAIGEPDPRDAIRVTGEPDVDLVIRGGLHGDIVTSAVVLNAIVGLFDLGLAPGLHTMNAIPLAGCVPPRS